MSNAAHSLKYRPEIDGLRALAVLSVLVFHAFPKVLPGGFVGVDIFFVISGYLISKILFDSFEQGRFTYRDFYRRRIVRIFPALVLVLLAVLGAGWLFFLSTEFELLGKHVFASAAFYQNINLLRESGYFDLSADFKPLLHIWSLAVEEQFYVVWPPLVWILMKRRSSLFRTTVILLLFSFAAGLGRIGQHPSSAFYEIQFRYWELLAGALVGWIHTYPENFKRRFLNSETRGVVGLLLLIAAFALIDEKRVFPGAWALLPVVGSALLISAQGLTRVNRLLAHRGLVAIGLISYPLYLWHWPLLTFARILMPSVALRLGGAAGVKTACLAASFALAWFTYKFVEQPFRRFSFWRIPSMPWLNPAVAVLFPLLVGIALFGQRIQTTGGYPERAASANMDPRYRPDPESSLRKCDLNLVGVENCRTNARGAGADVVVIGDSHSLSLAPGLTEYYGKQGRTLHVFQVGDTLGLVGVGVAIGGGPSVNGVRSLASAFTWAAENHAKTVILISRGPVYVNGTGFGIDQRSIELVDTETGSREDREAIYSRGLARTFDFLKTRGIQAVFVYDNPELGFYPKDMCLERPRPLPGVKALTPCGLPRADVDRRQAVYRRLTGEVLVQHPEVLTFDPMAALCDADFCYAIKDGILLYGDHNHISARGAAWLARAFYF